MSLEVAKSLFDFSVMVRHNIIIPILVIAVIATIVLVILAKKKEKLNFTK